MAHWALALPAFTLSLLTACGGGEPSPDNGNGPSAPTTTQLVAVGSSARTTSLGWRPVPGATGYTLERRTATTAFAPIATLDGDADSFVDDGLAQQTAYHYRLVPTA